ncbi:MAG: T9SS type A sorting domain-containing protein [Candidatus Stahlbacteria bacterium]|nr:T9SS type A sorting domain-containing protein [Candidatus Stahlbacteria bacterium]
MKGIWLIVVGMISSSLYGVIGDDPDAFLKELQARLAKQGNPWVAGKTSVSHLSWAEKQNKWGGMEEPITKGYVGDPYVRKSKDSPKDEMDWRNYNGHNWMTSVKDQGTTNACWAFAWVAAQEARWKFVNNQPSAEHNLSEQFCVSCNPYGYTCTYGGSINMVSWVQSTGIPDEACFPWIYYSYPQCERPCTDRCSDWATRAEKITNGGFSSSISVATAKDWLMDGPIAGAINQTKEDIFYYKGGNYEPIMGRTLQPNHGVCIVGWNTSNYWIYKNSWGPGWGSGGYGTINYLYWGAWMDPISNTTPPAIWTTPRLDFSFGGKAYSSQSYSNSAKMTNESQSDELNYILMSGERILGPSEIVTVDTKIGEDTIKYDGAGRMFGWYGPSYWGVRFTPLASCNVVAAVVARYTRSARTDSLIVRDDAGGTPGSVVAGIPYNTLANDTAKWYRQNLPTPYSESNDFWLTYYAVTDSAYATQSYFLSDSTATGHGARSYYYTTTWNNMSSYGVDFVIRAIVTYGGGFAGSGTIWVKNTGGGELTISNVSNMFGSPWIASIEPTVFSVMGGDSAGVTVSIDTTGLTHGETYSDTIVVVSNAGTNKVPVTIIVVGVEEGSRQQGSSVFKVGVNPLAENRIKISYTLPSMCRVKITLCDIAGREVAKIVDEYQEGAKEVEWDTNQLPSGIYFCHFTTANAHSVKKVVLIR